MQGLVLTSTNDLACLPSAMQANNIPLLKVVTAWGMPSDSTTISELTKSERNVLRLMARGLANEAIATQPQNGA